VIGALAVLVGCAHAPRGAELAVLEASLRVERSATVADVGAGRGDVAVALATKVVPEGTVIATEVEEEKLTTLAATLRREGAGNVRVVLGSPVRTGLEPASCDAVLMRGVYHHLERPEPLLSDVLRALRPGGRLVIVDFAPSVWLAPWDSAEQRGGHGVAAAAVVREATHAGFVHVATVDRYPGLFPLAPYLVAFQKPRAAGARAAR